MVILPIRCRYAFLTVARFEARDMSGDETRFDGMDEATPIAPTLVYVGAMQHI